MMMLFFLPKALVLLVALASFQKETKEEPVRLNVLFAISDDQSWIHTSAAGCRFIHTPAFDLVATEGVLFENAMAPSPSCSPSRASILTGRNIWENREAGVHISYFPSDLTVFTSLLEDAGYHVGYTGKGWSPGNWQDAGWETNPVGKAYNKRSCDPPAKGMSKNDYAGNFDDFLSQRTEGQPFFFWYGAGEPHRGYEWGSGERSGKKLESVDVPPFLIDNDTTRTDLLDYALEIEWFDAGLARMLRKLEEIGELDNTVVIVTSDNGMPFPRAKIQLYEFGTHVPLAIRWGGQDTGGRIIKQPVSLIDLAPTILEAAEVPVPEGMSCRSLTKFLRPSGRMVEEDSGAFVVTGKERHEYSRPDNMGYPVRGLRTQRFLYLRNFRPERWPAGDPPLYRDGEMNKPSGKTLLANRDRKADVFQLHVRKRPAEELYDVEVDAACIHNLADDPQYAPLKEQLAMKLSEVLTRQRDPRMIGPEDVFDGYPVFKPMVMKDKQGNPYFPGFSELGVYNRRFLPGDYKTIGSGEEK